MASEPTPPAAPPPTSPPGEASVIPAAITAVGSIVTAFLAERSAPPPRPEPDAYELERLRRNARLQELTLQSREREMEELRRAAHANAKELEQIRRAASMNAQELAKLRDPQRPVQRDERRTYAWCRQFRMLLKTKRPPTSRSQRAQFLRVGRLSLFTGEALDAAGVC